jgi:hypothetical protein
MYSTTSIHHVHHISLAKHHPVPTPDDCRISVLHLFPESLSENYLRLFVAFAVYLGNIIKEGNIINAYAHAHAHAEGTLLYIVIYDVFQAWFRDHFGANLTLGYCILVSNNLQGHPIDGTWW